MTISSTQGTFDVSARVGGGGASFDARSTELMVIFVCMVISSATFADRGASFVFMVLLQTGDEDGPTLVALDDFRLGS